MSDDDLPPIIADDAAGATFSHQIMINDANHLDQLPVNEREQFAVDQSEQVLSHPSSLHLSGLLRFHEGALLHL